MSLLRHMALFARSRSEKRDRKNVLHEFEAWKKVIENLPALPRTNGRKLALVRLDDIGDYLLFRNCLFAWQSSKRFQEYHITLIGNVVWKPIFDRYDAAAVEDTIWVDKGRYFSDERYRIQLWQDVRNAGFTTIICPSRTRPLLLDDMIVLAAAAKERMASANSFAFESWNTISDALYTNHFRHTPYQHEFSFNRSFAEYTTGLDLSALKLSLASPADASPRTFILCFIGASARSKTWPLQYWVGLVKLLQEQGYTPLLAGGKNEMPLAEKIVNATSVQSIVGTASLLQTLEAIDKAQAVISGDTMAAHAAVAFQRPVVIVANGVNAARFVDYRSAGFGKVTTVYTKEYQDAPKGEFYKAVSRDMHSISPEQVFDALEGLLR